ncbi:MAG: hypothetical protein SH868_13735 [Bythopirellula sp.]|nr:hypothetical protein [Bythopirellula sp.]
MSSRIPSLVWRLVFAAALVAVFFAARSRADDCCGGYVIATAAPFVPQADSWVFARGRYTHDPATGARVAQYDQVAPVEPLDDPRAITSGYNRTRMVLRGADGSANTYYQVQSYGNGRGGLDAEWERFHDAWRGSTVAGGAYSGVFSPFGFGGFGPGGYGGGGYGGGGYGPGNHGGYPGHHGPGNGYPPPWDVTAPSYGFGSAGPDPRRLDPDAADGYRDGVQRRESNREFFRPIPKAGFAEPHDHD